MRRTGLHAVDASFHPFDDRTRDVLARGEPISSVAVFENVDDLAPISLLLDSNSPSSYEGLVRLELAVDPEKTRRLPRGVEFELVAGKNTLGRGHIHNKINIFESLARATSRYEVFHSQYLADALTTSLEGDRSLFDQVWRLVAPGAWGVPEDATVVSEKVLHGGRRIDLLIADRRNDRVVGIEVKTVDASAQLGQLTQYWKDLCNQPGGEECVALAYLTPFNGRTGDAEESEPKTVQVFHTFAERLSDEYGKEFADDRARQVSWLDVAAIPWDGNELWQQHREYVYRHISGTEAWRISTKKGGRTFDDFFGRAPAEAFWRALGDLGIAHGTQGVVLDVCNYDLAQLSARLVGAIKTLTDNSTFVSRDIRKEDRFSCRSEFLGSPYAELHRSLFGLTKNSCFWLQGSKNYGVRVAHENYPSGVSLVTSRGPSRLEIGKPR